MPACTPINGLRLDADSLAALERIRNDRNVEKYLSGALSVGVFANIFARSNLPTAAYNISQTDWDLYKITLQSVPKIVSRAIEDETDSMLLHFQKKNDYKQTLFWQGLYNGCY